MADLPQLTGTPKQIAWAEKIRADWLAPGPQSPFDTEPGPSIWDDVVEAFVNRMEKAEHKAVARQAANEILYSNSAATWIDFTHGRLDYEAWLVRRCREILEAAQ